MSDLEEIIRYYINKKRKSTVLSYKEEMFFEYLMEIPVAPSLIIEAINTSYYKKGNKITINSIKAELLSILKSRGHNANI